VARQFGLGKGLGALIPDPEPVPIDEYAQDRTGTLGASLTVSGDSEKESSRLSGHGILRVALGKIEPNPDQPRKTFDEESIGELANSILRHGLIQPIIVEDIGEGRFRIIAGERRWRAAERVALKEIPVIVRSFTPEKRLEIALIENVQREDLNPVEEAEAYRSIMGLTGVTQEEVADKVGKSRPAIANSLRLLRLPHSMLTAIRDGAISAGHARALLSVSDPANREYLFARLLAEGLSVRQAEAAAQELSQPKRSPKKQAQAGSTKPEKREAELIEAEQVLIGAFGTKVKVQGDLTKGTITIEYYSLEDLERILETASR
jgi:ParB family chromosome partitioning protein